MNLEELYSKRRELDSIIESAEQEQEEKSKLEELQANYTAIVCTNCFGTGSITVGGADIISDPPMEDTCEDCKGLGFVYARNFEHRKDYRDSMQFDTRNGINDFYNWTKT